MDNSIPQDTDQTHTPTPAQISQTSSNQLQTSGASDKTKTVITVVLLVLIYPIGLLLMWLWEKWPRWAKILISLPLMLAILGIVASSLLMSINPSKQIDKANCYSQCDNLENGVERTSCIDACIATFQ